MLIDKGRWARWILGGWIFFLVALLLLVWPGLQRKRAAEHLDRWIAVAVNWNDLETFSKREETSLADLLNQMRAVSVRWVAVEDDLTSSDESLLRQAGCHLVWKLKSGARVDEVLHRFQNEDAVISTDDKAPAYPGLFPELSRTLREKNGLLLLPEFLPQKGLTFLAQMSAGNLAKAHVLSQEETLFPKTEIWRARLIRALESRWVRFLLVGFSPQLDFRENTAFLSAVAMDADQKGFKVGERPAFQHWRAGFTSMSLTVFIAVVAPLFVVFLIRFSGVQFPALTFLTGTLLTVLAGVVIHGLGAFPDAVLGLTSLRGVKLQLVAPLVLGFVLLLKKEELSGVFNRTLTVKHVFWSGGLLLVFLGMYLMRSGNFPLLPVTDLERRLRDGLENWMIARPRFKEFLIGHPLMILGLSLRSRWMGPPDFIRDGRLWIGLGVLGQISIANTFCHFSAPLHFGLIRTLHGVWIGFLIGWALCLVFSKKGGS